MFIMMREALKQMILGTAFEPVVRRLQLKLTNDKNARYDRQTIDILTRVLRENSNCVDVGCHKGSVLKEMVRLSPRGHHFAFEPIPDLYAELVKSFSSVVCINSALSDVTGTASFNYVSSNPGFSGLRRRVYPKKELIREIEVRVERLDDVVPDDITIHFMKVDVEGAELNVFRGAKRILSQKPIVIFEHGLGAADCYGHRPEAVFDVLGDCGLRISLLQAWLSGTRPLAREEFVQQFETGSNFYFVAHPN